MAFKETVSKLLHKGLEDKPNLFLVDLAISQTNKISILIDGDNGVNVQDCIDISRAVEHNLDREEQDFSIDVASVGIGTPLKMIRQYKNNIDRMLIVKLENQTIEAKLTHANDTEITLSWQAREPKKIGKGKETVDKTQIIRYSEIKEAIVTVIF